MASSPSQNQRCYVQLESTYGTIPNSTGAATVANADAVMFSELNLTGDSGIIERPDKTPGYGRIVGAAGRKSASWSLGGTLCPSGVAGTKPDWDEIFQAAFGVAATVVASTSVTYNLGNGDPSLAVWEFFDAMERCAFGSVVDSLDFSLGDGYATVRASGPSRWVLDKGNFSGHDTTGKGGLTAWPTAPTTPSYQGTGLTTFTGTATLDGQTYLTLRNLSISLRLNRSLMGGYIFNGSYAGLPARGRREVSVSFDLTDDNGANLTAMKLKALSKTTLAITAVVGTTAGNIATFSLPRVLLAMPSYDSGGLLLGARFSGSAYASVGTAYDDMTLALT